MDKPIRPETLPGTVRPGDRPGRPGGNRPERPDRPGLGNGNRPNLPDIGDGRPNRPGSGNGNRPNLPDIGDGRPNRPGSGNGNRPNLPDIGDGRPGLGNGNRPGRPGRPGSGDGINIGDINIGNNNVISNRPSWVNIDNDRISNINNRWQNQIGGIQNWRGRYPDRGRYWNDWGNGVRNHWGNYHHHDNWFGPNWWNGHRHNCGGWHYGYGFNSNPWSYWWTVPTFATFTNWFTWSAPSTVWSQPVYYDYGQGGNVVYENNAVYIDGQQVASSEEFAESAAALATVEPPESEEVAAEAEWLPLGTFAVSSSDKDVEPSRILQLAVNKQGIISGTLFNTQTDQAETIQGKVDQETQRVAFRIGESEDVVVESGLYNLTQDEAPVLVHFGGERVENWLLVRLENPEADESVEPTDL